MRARVETVDILGCTPYLLVLHEGGPTEKSSQDHPSPSSILHIFSGYIYSDISQPGNHRYDTN